MAKNLIVSHVSFIKKGYSFMTYKEFGSLKVSQVANYDRIVFVCLDKLSKKEANLVNIASATYAQVFVMCNDPDKCTEEFKNLLEINGSKKKIEFTPDFP